MGLLNYINDNYHLKTFRLNRFDYNKLRMIISFDTETYNDNNVLKFLVGSVTYVSKDDLNKLFKDISKNRKQRIEYYLNKHTKTFTNKYEMNEFIYNLIRNDKNGDKTQHYLIVAHNVNFDLKVINLIDYLRNKDFVLRYYVSYENITIVQFFKVFKYKENNDYITKKKYVTIIDSMNYTNFISLESLSKMMDYEKLDYDVTNITVENKDIYLNDRLFIEYNRKDTKIVAFFFVLLLWDKTIRNYFDYTASRIFLNILYDKKKDILQNLFSLTKRYNTYTMYFDKLINKMDLEKALENKEFYEKIFNLASKSFKGGRTEVFERGLVENVVVLDVNSMYPYSMKKPLPEVILGVETGISVKEFKERRKTLRQALRQQKKELLYIIEFEGCINDIKTKRSDISLILEKLKDDTVGYELLKSIKGESTYVLTNVEFEQLEKYGIVNVYEIKTVIWIMGSNWMSDVIDKLYKNRLKYKKMKSFKKVLSHVYKILMNSGFGKFAQKVQKLYRIEFKSIKDIEQFFVSIGKYYIIENMYLYNLDFLRTTLKIDDEYYLMEIDLKNKVIIVKESNFDFYSSKSNVLVSTFITAYARAYLNELIVKTKDCIYYVDTDSIHINKKCIDKVSSLIGNELGMLKKEIESEFGFYITNKAYFLFDIENDYVIIKRIRMKGVKTVNLINTLSSIADYMDFDGKEYTFKIKIDYFEFLKDNELQGVVKASRLLDVEKVIDFEQFIRKYFTNDSVKIINTKRFNKVIIQEFEKHYTFDYRKSQIKETFIYEKEINTGSKKVKLYSKNSFFKPIEIWF